MSTSAFSTATVRNRDFSGTVTNDNNALLRLDPTVSPYAGESGGELTISIDGLNQNADFTFNQVFRIHNDGTESVDISLSLTDNPGSAVEAAPSEKNTGATADLLASSLQVDPGQYVDVGVEITVGSGTGTFSGEFNVEAT